MAGLIVPEYSASIDGFNVKTSTIPANYMDMCKFDNPGDIGYRRISGHILTFTQQATKEVAQGKHTTGPGASVTQASTPYLVTSSESGQSAKFSTHVISLSHSGDSFEVEEV